MGTLVRPTNAIVGRDAGAWTGATPQFAARDAGVTKNAKLVSARVGGVWGVRYSTPNVTASGGGAANNSGASPSGTVGSQIFATPGGEDSGSRNYSWAYLSGDASYYLPNADPTNPNPLIYHFISGAANGGSAVAPSAVWRVTMTDPNSGASVYSDVTVGPFTWNNTIPAFSPHTNAFNSGAGTEYVPTGATTLTIRRVAGAGGGGNAVYNTPLGDYKGGNGGGSGAYKTQTIAISPSDWGAPIYWSVGAGASLWPNVGGTTSTTGSVAAGSVSDSVPGGTGGASGAVVVAGSSTGGSPAGNNGTNGSLGAAGVGGASPYGGYGKGGDGGYPGGGQLGGNGGVEFIWG